MYIRDIIEATSGTLLSGNVNDYIEGFTQDSRQCYKNYMYIPIKGQNHDGYDYIEMAFANGASAILTEKKLSYKNKSKNIVLVADTTKALGDIARFKRDKSKAIVVGVTGSVGKTSTKDMIFSVVQTKYKALKTLGNYNNHLGVPLTILRYQDEDAMIVEMGMNHLGEIDYLSRIAKPNIAVITNVGTAHIGELGSRENILKAKLEIINGLVSDGKLIINNDNDLLSTIEKDNIDIKTIGIERASNLQATNLVLNSDCSTFEIEYNSIKYKVYVPVAGRHFVYNALIAIQVGLELGIDIENCIKGVSNFELTQNRADIIELKHNIKLYDGSYNANYDSMIASIDVLAGYTSRKIAILGDMLELGGFEESLHRQLGRYISKYKIDYILLVGKGIKYTYDELISLHINNVFMFKNNQELIKQLDLIIQDEDVIFLKASHSIHLDEIVNHLKEKFSK